MQFLLNHTHLLAQIYMSTEKRHEHKDRSQDFKNQNQIVHIEIVIIRFLFAVIFFHCK